MRTLTNASTPCRTKRGPRTHQFCGGCAKGLLFVLLAGTMLFPACGGGSYTSSTSQIPPNISGNWQFTMAQQINSDPTKPSFRGGLLGGFLLQTNGTITGAAAYSIMTQPPAGSGGTPAECDHGTDEITGKISGQNVTLMAASTSPQSFALTGTLSLDGTTMTGIYTSTDGAGCGTAATQAWSAILVPPLSGSITGTFQSQDSARANQVFPVTGSLAQGDNVGTSSVTVTGSLSFVDPVSNLSVYPCLVTASVQGTISGNTVILQLSGNDGSTGQIGTPSDATIGTVTFDSTSTGYILHSKVGTGYEVSTAPTGPCPAVTTGSTTIPGDEGSICLGLGTSKGCQQPVTLSPDVVTFPPQAVGPIVTMQTITLTNSSGTKLSDLTMTFTNNPTTASNFAEMDDCVQPGPSTGVAFSLLSGQSCTITISFSPQEASPLISATLAVTAPVNGNNEVFAVPITGIGVNATAVSTPDRDFDADRDWLATLPCDSSFTDPGRYLVQTPSSKSQRTFQDVEHHAEID